MSTNNLISDSAILIGDVKLGEGNVIAHNAVLIGPLEIGNNNYIGQNVLIGGIPQDDIHRTDSHRNSLSGSLDGFKGLKIGSNNVFREFSSVHRGGFRDTIIGDDNFIMSYTNISHDSIIGSNVKIASNVTLGGFVQVQDYSYLGMSACVLQFIVIGKSVMVGAHSTVTTNLKPGVLVIGSPARISRFNEIGLRKLGVVMRSNIDKYTQSSFVPVELLEACEIYDEALAKNEKDRDSYRNFRNKLIDCD